VGEPASVAKEPQAPDTDTEYAAVDIGCDDTTLSGKKADNNASTETAVDDIVTEVEFDAEGDPRPTVDLNADNFFKLGRFRI